MCGIFPGALGLPSSGRYYLSRNCHPPPSAFSAMFTEVITNYYGIFFLFLPRLFLPTTHNPAPVIYICQLALMPARHQVPLLVSRRQPVCTKWCHPRVQLLSSFQSLQQFTDRQWSERLQPRGFPSKFYLFHPQQGVGTGSPENEYWRRNCLHLTLIDLFGCAVQDKSQHNLRCTHWNKHCTMLQLCVSQGYWR